MKYFVGAAALSLCAGMAQAQETATDAPEWLSEVRLGVLAHDTGPFGSRREDGVGVNVEVLFESPHFMRWIGSPRPHIGGTYAFGNGDAGTTSQGYFGVMWEADFWNDRLFAYFSLGGAVHSNSNLRQAEVGPDRKALGCRVLFRESLGLGYNLTEHWNVALHLDHISNGNLCDNNQGIDNTGVRVGYRF